MRGRAAGRGTSPVTPAARIQMRVSSSARCFRRCTPPCRRGSQCSGTRQTGSVAGWFETIRYPAALGGLSDRDKCLAERLAAADRIGIGTCSTGVAGAHAVSGAQPLGVVTKAGRHVHAIGPDGGRRQQADVHGADGAGDLIPDRCRSGPACGHVNVHPQPRLVLILVQVLIVLGGELRMLANLAGKQVELARRRVRAAPPRPARPAKPAWPSLRCNLDLAAGGVPGNVWPVFSPPAARRSRAPWRVSSVTPRGASCWLR